MRHRDTILVVDDDSDACEALGGLLEESGFSVEAAETACARLARLDGSTKPAAARTWC